MRYRLQIKEAARQQLRALSKEERRSVGRRLDALQASFTGDVKKLTATTHEYRMRVGSLRGTVYSGKGSDQRVRCEGSEESL